MHYLVSGSNPKRYGNGAPSVFPSQAFRCADGRIVMVAGNDGQFRRLCTVLGLPQLAEDARYRTNGDRVLHRDTLMPELEKAFATRSKAEWLDALGREGLAAGPINDLSEVFADPQIEARQIVTRVKHVNGGTVPLIVSPMRMSETPLDVYTAPPTCGQHTDEVLRGILGWGDDDIGALNQPAPNPAAPPT
jgi:formyl-CoA transferase